MVKTSNCANNKMLEYDWLLTALIYGFNWLFQEQTVPFDLSHYEHL